MALPDNTPVGYGVFRFLVEFVRVPDENRGYLLFGWVTTGQLLSLPMIFVIENNGYAYSTPASEQFAAGTELWKRSAGYGIESFALDCTRDVTEVARRLGAAIEQVRTTSRPLLIEANVPLSAASLRKAGVRAVALLAGELGTEIAGERKTQAELAAAGFPARLFVMSRVGHLYPDDMDRLMSEAFAFVLSQPDAQPDKPGAP